MEANEELVKKSVLYVNDLNIEYKNVKNSLKIVSGGSFYVKPGELVLIVGDNGTGKSSIFRSLILEKSSFSSNSIMKRDLFFLGEFLGTDKDSMRKFRTSIGYARQEDDKDPLWSRKVGDIVFDYAEGSSLFNSKNEIEDSINAAYSGLHCETYAGGELMKRRIDVCSGGEKRMVAILSAFSRINSKLFILDEPVNNLDGEHSRYLNNFIIDLKHKQNPPGILIITHCHMFHKVDRAYKLIKDKTGGGVLTEISNYCTMSDSCFGKCDINGKYNI